MVRMEEKWFRTEEQADIYMARPRIFVRTGCIRVGGYILPRRRSATRGCSISRGVFSFLSRVFARRIRPLPQTAPDAGAKCLSEIKLVLA